MFVLLSSCFLLDPASLIFFSFSYRFLLVFLPFSSHTLMHFPFKFEQKYPRFSACKPKELVASCNINCRKVDAQCHDNCADLLSNANVTVRSTSFFLSFFFFFFFPHFEFIFPPFFLPSSLSLVLILTLSVCFFFFSQNGWLWNYALENPSNNYGAGPSYSCDGDAIPTPSASPSNASISNGGRRLHSDRVLASHLSNTTSNSTSNTPAPAPSESNPCPTDKDKHNDPTCSCPEGQINKKNTVSNTTFTTLKTQNLRFRNFLVAKSKNLTRKHQQRQPVAVAILSQFQDVHQHLLVSTHL